MDSEDLKKKIWVICALLQGLCNLQTIDICTNTSSSVVFDRDMFWGVGIHTFHDVQGNKSPQKGWTHIHSHRIHEWYIVFTYNLVDFYGKYRYPRNLQQDPLNGPLNLSI